MKTTQPTIERILAIYCLTRGFAYAIFEGSNDLIDWGGVTVTDGANECRERAEKIMRHYLVDLVITEDPTKSSHRGGKARSYMKAIRETARNNGTSWQGFTRTAVRKTFAGFTQTTKHEIATMIAARYPELTFDLPPPRKIWKAEHHRMGIFDAAALASTYFVSRRRTREVEDRAPRH